MAAKKRNRRVGVTGLFDRHPVLWILLLGVSGVSAIAFYMTQDRRGPGRDHRT